LDKAFFAAFSKELQAQLERLEKQIYDYVGESFNINSTQQLSDMLLSVG